MSISNVVDFILKAELGDFNYDLSQTTVTITFFATITNNFEGKEIHTIIKLSL